MLRMVDIRALAMRKGFEIAPCRNRWQELIAIRHKGVTMRRPDGTRAFSLLAAARYMGGFPDAEQWTGS